MRTFGRLIIAGVLLASGFAAGIYWHSPASPPAPPSPVTSGAQLWTCGMHPQVIQDHPGFCPICGMALTPLKKSGPAQSNAVSIDPVVVQNMGVRTTTALERPVTTTIRAVGYLAEAQPNQHDINLRVSGWVQRLHADTEGVHIHAGAPLFDLYSPELQVAISELIAARHARDHAPAVYDAAARKLAQLGLGDDQIRRFATLEAPPSTVTFSSPVTGHLVEKMVVEGSAVKAGDRVLRIVDHTILWLDAQVYERDLPAVRIGQKVSATVAAKPGLRFLGSITFIHPHVDPMTRAAMVRIALSNTSFDLRPNMWATAEITADIGGDVVVIPREAIIDTGTRQMAFVALDAGHFEPRTLILGAQGDGMVQVRAGIAVGENVVTSGQFLLDSESRLQEAIQKHLSQKLLRTEGNASALPGSAEALPSVGSRDATGHRHGQ